MKFETDRFVCDAHRKVAHVRFKGPHVAEYTEAVQLGPELRRAAAALDFDVMILDCENLPFLTSTMLEAFVAVHVRCRKAGKIVRIVHAEPLVRELLRTTHIDKIIPVFDRLDEAMQADE